MTDSIDEPPTLAERYQRAVNSSHLRAEDGRCDVDYLIAAGWLKDGLGPALYRLRGEFDTVRASVRRGPMNSTEMMLVLSQLKTLQSTKQAFGAFAETQATKAVYMQPPQVVAALAGRVLSVWLDKLCHACEGRGFNGGTHRGEAVVKCRGCGGFGERRSNLGDSMEDRRFARLLMDAIASQLAAVDRAMRTRLRESGQLPPNKR